MTVSSCAGRILALLMLVFALTVTGGRLAAAEAKPGHTVLAAHPAVVALASALAEGTDIKVEAAVSPRLPFTRWQSYFEGRGSRKLQQLASEADAVIGLRSLWPQDPLFPLARRINFRILEIDAAAPLDHALPGIALSAGTGMGHGPWWSPDNLGRMADIIAADLARLAPGSAGRIDDNLAGFRRRLLVASVDVEMALLELDEMAVISLSDRLSYLVSGLNLESVPFQAPQTRSWSEDQIAALVSTIRDSGVGAVLHHTSLPDDVHAAIVGAGASPLVIAPDGDSVVAQWRQAANAVIAALK